MHILCTELNSGNLRTYAVVWARVSFTLLGSHVVLFDHYIHEFGSVRSL